MDDERGQTAEHLTLEEFTDTLIAGTRARWLKERADALLDAVDALMREQQPFTAERHRSGIDSPHALHRTLQNIVRCMRAQIDPFAGTLEAPRAVAELYRKHSQALKAAETARAAALEPLLRDAAAAWFACLGPPLLWADLTARGVPREAPEVPVDADDY